MSTSATANSQEVKEIYNQTAKEYEEFVIPCKLCQYLILMHELNIGQNENVLELGSGPGYLSIEIAKIIKNGSVIGVDISEKMVELASTKAKEWQLDNLEFIVGDVTKLNFEDETFDICVNSYLIHWIPQPVVFLKEIFRILKHGGKVGIIAPSPEWYSEIQQAYRNVIKKYNGDLKEACQELVGLKVYTEHELEDMLTNVGFDVQKIIAFRFKENIPIQNCLRVVNAKSNETYLSQLPEQLREQAKQELKKELSEISNKLVTTESGYIVIAQKT